MSDEAPKITANDDDDDASVIGQLRDKIKSKIDVVASIVLCKRSSVV